jgi:hypothetical protein
MWPHLTTSVVLVALGLRALWKTPDWGLKLVMLAEAVRRYRKGSKDAHGS